MTARALTDTQIAYVQANTHLPVKDVAAELGVSPRTVERYRTWTPPVRRPTPQTLKPATTLAVQDPYWRDQAACVGLHDWFTPDTPDPDITATAINVCRSCPVTRDCLTTALAHGDDGIRGGTTPRQRKTMRRENTA